MPELTKKKKKVLLMINTQGDKGSVWFLDTKIGTPHTDDGILILWKLKLKLTSKGPGLQPNIENSQVRIYLMPEKGIF